MTPDQAPGQFPPETLPVLEALANEHRLRIATHLADQGRSRFSDLMDLTELTTGGLNPHLDKLQEGGIITRVRDLPAEEDDAGSEGYVLSRFGARVLTHLDRAFAPQAGLLPESSSTTDPPGFGPGASFGGSPHSTANG